MASINEKDVEEIWQRNAKLPAAVSTCVQDLIAQTAHKLPSAPAICAWDGNFNYEQLLGISSQIADHILSHGIKPGTVLPLLFNKSKLVPLAMIGALKADCAIALLDPSIPTERLRRIIALLKSTFILTTSDLLAKLDSTAIPIMIDNLELDRNKTIEIVTTKKDYSSRYAAVVFTSGSTGHPKGVMLSPECLSTTAVHGSQLFQLDRTSRVFQFASYSFDVSLHETLMTLVAGGCLCIPSEYERLNTTHFAIKAFNANWICITPSAASSLLSEAVVAPIETIVFTGEAVTRSVCKFLNKCKVFSWYGASEVPLVSVNVLRTDTWNSSQIGTGNPGICWLVKPDDAHVLCAKGEVGELLVEGPMQTEGYLNSPESDRTAFVNDPVWLTRGSSEISGRTGKLYKTGDLVKYDKDGTLVYISRKDSMVKIRGQRVELREVEHQIWNSLTQDGSVDGCNYKEIVADSIKPADSDNAILVSFICIQSSAGKESNGLFEPSSQRLAERTPIQTSRILSVPDEAFKQFSSSLDQRLRQILPEYMIPALYFKLYSVPVTISGKIDRKLLRGIAEQMSLKDLVEYRMLSSEGHATPRSEIERSLRTVWSKALGIDENLISTTISFVQYGGDSLTALTLGKNLKKNYQISTKVSWLLRKETTIQQLAILIENSRNGKLTNEPSLDVPAEVKRWIAELEGSCAVTPLTPAAPKFSKPQVFLTGATGYLGTQILNQLVCSHEVGKIIVLVRAIDVSHAKQRIQASASISGWWTTSASRRIETWVGNLAEPRFGLDEDKWNQIALIDTIIHNGAVVSWAADCHALESVNIRSTYQLLQAALESHHLRRLIYVSGGIKQGQDQSDVEYIKNINDSEGYSQTKYISEQLILAAGRLYNERARTDAPPQIQDGVAIWQKVFTVVKPGYIIGDRIMGVSNIDDFLWKIVAGAVRMQSYPQEPTDSWLDLAEVTHVARYIFQQCNFTLPNTPAVSMKVTLNENCYANKESTTVKYDTPSKKSAEVNLEQSTNTDSTKLFSEIGRGLSVSRFWQAVQTQINFNLKQMDWSSWVNLAYQDLELETEDHPLWGIQQFMGPRLGNSPPCTVSDEIDRGSQQELQQKAKIELEVEAAVRRCVQYLVDIKFILIPAVNAAPPKDGPSRPIKRKRSAEKDIDNSYNKIERSDLTPIPRTPNTHQNLRQCQKIPQLIGRSKFTQY